MKAIKRILFGLFTIAIIIGIGFILLKRTNEQRITDMISSDHVTIDQEIHDWNVCKDNRPVKITMYIRNNGQYKISGTLVFLVTLSIIGLEEEFLIEFIDCYGEERLKKEMKEEIKNKRSIGRLEAVYNYLLRGRKIPKGQKYEPVQPKKDSNDYVFKFRKQVLMHPGEILKIDHEQPIPLDRRGYLLNLKIESIEL